MATCFVIQPFDKGKFDKRYEGVFEPAIMSAGLTPYRADRDHSAEVLIDSIEENIRAAAVCLADVTADNPNVWYELGYAFARGRPVVMVCSIERVDFPFDIQHRAIITYATDAPSDFETLRTQITEKILALLSKNEALRQLEESVQVAPVAGLAQTEISVLVALASNTLPTGNSYSLYQLKNDVEKTGLTPIGYALGLRKLIDKHFIEVFTEAHQTDNYDYEAGRVTDKGWAWITKNEEKFILRRERKTSRPTDDSGFDDDIPF